MAEYYTIYRYIIIEEKDEKGRYLRRERCYGTCSRSFYVGDIDEKTIKASYSDGILTVTIPQDQPKKLEEKKRIEIE